MTQKTHTTVVRGASMLLLFISACNPTHSDGPTRATIEAHTDTTVTVFGPYAVVKLPLTNGVRVWNPTQIEASPAGVMYVANKGGEIYTLHDADGDGLEDTAQLFCDVSADGLVSPTALAFYDDELFVGTGQAIVAYTDTDGDGRADRSRTVFDDIPFSDHPYELTSGLTFADDGSLYFSLTTDSWNAGASPDPDGIRGALMRIAPDGEVQRFATGLRSVHGMAMAPDGELLFVDNAGGGNATEELNVARRGAFYGHNPEKYDAAEITAPAHDLATEVAPGGIAFNAAENSFGGTGGDLFVSFYGPGERWNRGGIGRLQYTRETDGSHSFEEFAVARGLPKASDVAFGPTGDLYVTHVGRTDYWYQGLDAPDGSVYRLIEVPWIAGSEPESTTAPIADVSPDSRDRGRQLFVDRACSACHAVDGTTEMLGPNLRDVSRIYSRAEILEEIEQPSVRIKPSMAATRVTKKGGEVLLGRVVESSTEHITIIGIGNTLTTIPRSEIRATEDVRESLMYTGLLEGLTDQDKDDLLAYLESLPAE